MQDPNLLFATLALQLDYINSEQFTEAANAWLLRKHDSIGKILVDRGVLTQDDCDFLASIVAKRGANVEEEPFEKEAKKLAALVTVFEKDPTSGLHVPQGSKTQINNETDTATFQGSNKFDVQQRYRIVRDLAKGGLGLVSVARDCELDREVALKEILSTKSHSSEALTRFTSEAKVTGSLEHPGIVPIYGMGVFEDGRPFYAMRLIRGMSMQEAIKEVHAKSHGGWEDFSQLRPTLNHLIDACNALAYAHSRHVYHRDLKPSNIMLGKFGETLVVDWGLAKVSGDQQPDPLVSELPISDGRSHDSQPTMLGSILGTPAFMSPEQARGRIDLVDRRSDIFSLGATLYCILTNKPPFYGESREEVVSRAKKNEYQSIRSIDGRIPKALEAICNKAMATNPDDRYQTATELGEDLERMLAGDVVTAYPESLLEQAVRFAKRHQAYVLSGLVIVVGGAIGLLVMNSFIRYERNIAVTQRDIANEANKHARENLAAAERILSEFIVELTDLKWSQFPEMDKPREEMLAIAAKTFNDLAESNPDDDELKEQIVEVLIRHSNVLRSLSRHDRARAQLRSAIEIVNKILARKPNDDDALALKSDALFYRAFCDYNLGELDQAILGSEENLQFTNLRFQREPNEPRVIVGLVRNLIQHAEWMLETSELERASEDLKNAELAIANVPKEFEAYWMTIYQLEALLLQSLLDIELERYDAAQNTILKTKELADKAYRFEEIHRDLKSTEVKISNLESLIALAKANPALALEKTTATLEGNTSLETKFPDELRYKRQRIRFLIGHSRSLQASGISDEAKQTLDEAKSLLEKAEFLAIPALQQTRFRTEIAMLEVERADSSSPDSKEVAHQALLLASGELTKLNPKHPLLKKVKGERK